MAKLQRSLDGPAGVVVFRVGAGKAEKPLLQVGSFTTGVAWSTSKVPVTVAALARSSSSTTKARAKGAITRSDNAAATKLWAGLGSPTTAGRRTQAVVRAAGDSRTVVQSRVVRRGFTPFGQTRWRLDDQARFVAGLSCQPNAKATVRLMTRIVPEQRFGVGWRPAGPGCGRPAWFPPRPRSCHPSLSVDRVTRRDTSCVHLSASAR